MNKIGDSAAAVFASVGNTIRGTRLATPGPQVVTHGLPRYLPRRVYKKQDRLFRLWREFEKNGKVKNR